jgi:enamine deaminase RidA (YjgF/YER057c/UK114 family)
LTKKTTGGWYPQIAGANGFYPMDPASWPPTTAEHIDQAFENVDLALKNAGGAGWSQVYKVRVYYLDPACAGDLARNVAKWCPDHTPIFTAVQVAGLAFPEMQVEIEATANVPE